MLDRFLYTDNSRYWAFLIISILVTIEPVFLNFLPQYTSILLSMLISVGFAIQVRDRTDIQIDKITISELKPILLIGLLLSASAVLFSIVFVQPAEVSGGVSLHCIDTATVVYTVLDYLLIAPFAEEMFFRFFLISILLKISSPRSAIAFSTTLFVLYHNEHNMPIAFCVGIVNAIIYYKTRSFMRLFLIHVLANLPVSVIVVALFFYTKQNSAIKADYVSQSAQPSLIINMILVIVLMALMVKLTNVFSEYVKTLSKRVKPSIGG